MSYQLQIGEVPPRPDAGPEDSNRPQAPHQRPLEHHFRPDPPLDIGGLLAAMRGQVRGPSSRREVEGGKGVSNRCTYSWGAS